MPVITPISPDDELPQTDRLQTLSRTGPEHVDPPKIYKPKEDEEEEKCNSTTKMEQN